MPLSTRSVLQTFTKDRLLDLARTFAVAVPAGAAKETHVDELARSRRVRFRTLLTTLTRDDLKAACRLHGLDDSGRSRQALMTRLLEAHGAIDSAPPTTLFSAKATTRALPHAGDIVSVRRRQWLVQGVARETAAGQSPLVSLEGQKTARRIWCRPINLISPSLGCCRPIRQSRLRSKTAC